MIFIDTAYLVALALPDDALHGVAIRWSHSLGEVSVTTDCVIVEFFNALSKPRHREAAHQVYALLDSNPDFTVIVTDGRWLKVGVELHDARRDKGWSLTDCISFELMRSLNISRALTSDHHFEQAGFEVLLRKAPP